MGAISDFIFGKNRKEIDNEYSTALKNAGEERAKAVEQAAYNTSLYNANKDLFEQQGIGTPITAGEVSSAYADEMNNLEKERAKAWRQNKYNVFGNGVIGSLINPIAQTGSLAGDMLSAPFRAMAGEETNRYKRDSENDFISDLGALGETALDVATFGTSSGASAGAKTLGKTMGKGALLGAGYGATGALKDMGTEDFDLGQLALSTGIGAGVGGGSAGLGYGLGKVWNKYSQPAPSKSTDIIPYTGGTNTNATAYQDAINALKGYGLDPNDVSGTLKSAHRAAARATHPDNVGSDTAFKTIQDAYNVLSGKGGDTATKTATSVVPSTPELSFAQKLKNFGYNIPNMGKDLANTELGTNVADLLRTKRGKVLLGGSAGLTLAGLMKNKNDNSGQLSDEEMQELYNYVYGGQ